MRLDIRYRTVFRYPGWVRESQNELRACPVTDDRQQLLAYRVTAAPSARTLAYTDYWGTRVDHFGVRENHDELEILAEAAVETSPLPPIEINPHLLSVVDPEFRDLHGEYLERTRHTDWGNGVAARAERLTEQHGPDLVSTARATSALVHELITYEGGVTQIGEPVETLLRNRRGVCQDYAHLAVAISRCIGIPARYVSGYLFTSDDATGRMGGDLVHVQTHAWFEVAVPGYGWLPLDPTNQIPVGAQHVKIGHGRDYDDVPPLRGSYSGGVQPVVEAGVEIRRMDPNRAPATLVQPSAPRALEVRRLQEQQQQQQQQQ